MLMLQITFSNPTLLFSSDRNITVIHEALCATRHEEEE